MKQSKKLVVACLLIGMGLFVPNTWAQKKPSGSKPAAKPATTTTTPVRPTNTPTATRNAPAPRPAVATSRPASDQGAPARNDAERILTVTTVENVQIRVNNGPVINLEAGKPYAITLQRQTNDVQVIVPNMDFSWIQRAPRVAAGRNVSWELDMSRLYAERLRRLDALRINAEDAIRRQQRVVDSLFQVQQNTRQNTTEQPVTPPVDPPPAANTQTPPVAVADTAPSLPPIVRMAVAPPASPNVGQSWENSLNAQMVWIPGGIFKMGGNAYFDQRPIHPVDLTKGVWFGKFEVTQAEWVAVMGANPSSSKDPKKPVENVSYEEVQVFISRLNEREGTTLYRLPTEAEWEYVARAGSTRSFTWGNDTGSGRANCADCGSRFDGKETSPVGSFFPNAFGVYDVHGNVAEWVLDWYDEEYYKLPEASKDPMGPSSGTSRVIRGGSFDVPSDEMRVFVRGAAPGDFKGANIGFRLVRTAN